MPIVECVPNVSEGRRAEVIAACAEAIRASRARLLDTFKDISKRFPESEHARMVTETVDLLDGWPADAVLGWMTPGGPIALPAMHVGAAPQCTPAQIKEHLTT